MLDLRKTNIKGDIIILNNEYLKRTTYFIVKYSYKVFSFTIDLLYKIFDSVLVFFLFNFFKVIGIACYYLETKLYNHLKKSKYVKDDQFDKKVDEDKLIMLGMGLIDTKKITLREISYELGISEYYARRIKDIAKNWNKYFFDYKRIMKFYESDSDKNDKRSTINNIKDYD